MEHFGTQFERMRSVRGLSRPALARAANVHETTIFRLEDTGKCTWRDATVYSVLRALTNARALSPNEAKQFIDGTGLQLDPEVLKNAVATDDLFGEFAHVGARAAAAAAKGKAPATTDPVEAATAAVHRMAGLYTPAVAGALVSLLEEFAAKIAISMSGPIPAVKHTVVGNGGVVDIYTPTQQPPAPKARDTRKRRA